MNMELEEIDASSLVALNRTLIQLSKGIQDEIFHRATSIRTKDKHDK